MAQNPPMDVGGMVGGGTAPLPAAPTTRLSTMEALPHPFERPELKQSLGARYGEARSVYDRFMASLPPGQAEMLQQFRQHGMGGAPEAAAAPGVPAAAPLPIQQGAAHQLGGFGTSTPDAGGGFAPLKRV